MSHLTFRSRFAKSFLSEDVLAKEIAKAKSAKDTLYSKKGKGSEYLGWLHLPSSIGNEEITRIRDAAERIQAQSQYLVIVGIGGSYLGAKAVIDALTNPFSVFEENKKGVKILYAGHHLDADYHARLLAFLENRDFSVNVISKSGTTTEPAIAFRMLLSLLERKYGKEEMKKRVYSTTDSSKGALKKLSDDYSFTTFVIPDDVGGRFSVLTPVGLLPIAAAGRPIAQLLDGAKAMESELQENSDPNSNIALQYAAHRNAIYQQGKKIEILVNYNPALQYVTEWWKQLFGESEGKEKKGIFPAGVNFTTDLHSMGQYIQDGERHIFETVLTVASPKTDIFLTERPDDLDGLNYLSGKKLSEVNGFANLGTLVAHADGSVPCLEIEMPSISEFCLGHLLYFFEVACGISGYMLDVNPFDQPGVEDYKNNMFALLGKKGYEEKRKQIELKLK